MWSHWQGYLAAIRARRSVFRAHGAVATDHGHPTPLRPPILLPPRPRHSTEVVRTGAATAAQAELFRAQMLTELAQMSVDDGMVMQIHPGCLSQSQPSHLMPNTAAIAAPIFRFRPILPIRCGRC
jgi:glucuronate isomerase